METTVSYSGVKLSLSYDRRDPFFAHKAQWSYRLTDAQDATVILAEGSDLSVSEREGIAGAVSAFLSFLSAWAESSEDGENADLFPADMRGVVDWEAWSDMVSLWWNGADDE